MRIMSRKWFWLVFLIAVMLMVTTGTLGDEDPFAAHTTDHDVWYDGQLRPSEEGINIHIEPKNWILHENESIVAYMTVTGTVMPDKVTGFSVRINGTGYSSYDFDGATDVSSTIPYSVWRQYCSKGDRKISIYAVIYTTIGNMYRKETFILQTDGQEVCTDHKWKHHQEGPVGWLVCEKCGKTCSISYTQDSKADTFDEKLGLVVEEYKSLAQQTKVVGDADFEKLSEKEAYALLEKVFGKSMENRFIFITWPKDEVKDYFNMLTGNDADLDEFERDKIKRSFLFAAETLLESRSEIDRQQLDARVKRLQQNAQNMMPYQGVVDTIMDEVKSNIDAEFKDTYMGAFTDETTLCGLDEFTAWETLKGVYKAVTDKDDLKFQVLNNDTIYLSGGGKQQIIGSLTQNKEMQDTLKNIGYEVNEVGFSKDVITGYTEKGMPKYETHRYAWKKENSDQFEIDDPDFSGALLMLSAMDVDKWEATLNSFGTLTDMAESNEAKNVLEKWNLLRHQNQEGKGTIPYDHNTANMLKDAINASGNLKHVTTKVSDLDKYAEELFMVENSLKK